MLRKKCLCKINEIGNHTVIGICPEAGKLKTVAGLCLTCPPFLMLFFRIPSGTVGIIFRIRAVGNHKNLNVLIQSASCPEGFPLIAVDLVKCLADRNTSAFQLDMYKRQSVDQYRNIIAVIMLCAVLRANRVLINDLQSVIVNIGFIKIC